MRDFKMSTLPSTDGVNTLAVYTMEPDGAPYKGIVQLVHGMTEHIARYRHFAEFLCDNGYIVVGNDHLGHGKTSDNGGEDGYFGKKGSHIFVLRDVAKLMEKTRERFGNLPYFIFGHSMGSFFTRVLCYTYKSKLPNGVIISGTGGPNKSINSALFFSDLFRVLKGAHSHSKMLNDLAFKGFNLKIKEPRTAMDWLTRDEAVVDIYVEDKKCMFKFTTSALHELFSIHHKANNKDLVAKTPKTLPMLFISGNEDPVGLYGVGVAEAFEIYKQAGIEDLTLRLYPDARHELINETNKDEVYAQLLDWLNAHNKNNNDTTTDRN